MKKIFTAPMVSTIQVQAQQILCSSASGAPNTTIDPSKTVEDMNSRSQSGTDASGSGNSSHGAGISAYELN